MTGVHSLLVVGRSTVAGGVYAPSDSQLNDVDRNPRRTVASPAGCPTPSKAALCQNHMPRPLSITSAVADAVSTDLLTPPSPSSLRRSASDAGPNWTAPVASTSAVPDNAPQQWQLTDAQLELVSDSEDSESSSLDIEIEVCIYTRFRYLCLVNIYPARGRYAPQTAQLASQHRLRQVQCKTDVRRCILDPSDFLHLNQTVCHSNC